jgi:O-antigen/teichoic acid export membrane protein
MPIQFKGEAKLLAKHSIIFALGNFANQIVSFLLLPVYTRFLTPNDYGIKELIGLTTDIIGILLAMTIASAIQRFYFEYDNDKDRNEVISSAVILIGGSGLIAVACLFFAANTMARYILDNPGLGHFFQIAFVSMLFQAVNGVGLDYLRANQRSKTFVGFSFGKLAVGISLNIYFVCFLKIGVLGILLSTLITAFLVFLVLIVPLLNRIGIRFSLDKICEMARFGFPLALSQIGAFAVHLSDRFFVKAYWSVADAGLYSLGYRFGTLPGTFISVPFNQIWQPRRLEMYKSENSEQVFGRIFTYYLLLLVFCGLGVSVLTRDVLKVMADRAFWGADRIVPIIVVANIISMGLLIEKKTKHIALINGSNGLFVLILNYFLIKSYGVYGAAFATLIAFIYKIALTYYFSSKYYSIHFEFIRIAKIFVIGCILYLISRLTVIETVYLNILKDLAILCFYPVLLFVFKFLSANEQKELEDILKRRFIVLKKRMGFNPEC